MFPRTPAPMTSTTPPDDLEVPWGVWTTLAAFRFALQTGELPEPLTRDQVRRMRESAVTPEEEAVVVVLYHTGLRNSELRELTWEDIGWEKQELAVRRRKKKGWARDTLPLYDDQIQALRALQEWRTDDNPHLFPARRGPLGIGATARPVRSEGAMSGDTVCDRISAVADRAGIERDVWPHLFRHTRATWSR